MLYCNFEKPDYSDKLYKWHNPRSKSTDIANYKAGAEIYCIKLLRNYRSHPEILKVPNELFYRSELQPFADELVSNRYLSWDRLTNDQIPILFMHTVSIRLTLGR
jgi:superfamily I DNA and/or RNA helicase